MKALADTQNTLPGPELGNCDNRIIALDIKDDPEDEYLPDEPNEDEYEDLFYDDDIDEEEVNKADEQGSHEEHGLNEIIGDATNDNPNHLRTMALIKQNWQVKILKWINQWQVMMMQRVIRWMNQWQMMMM